MSVLMVGFETWQVRIHLTLVAMYHAKMYWFARDVRYIYRITVIEMSNWHIHNYTSARDIELRFGLTF